MWNFDINTAGAVDPTGVNDGFDSRDEAIEAAIADLQEEGNNLLPESVEELRTSGTLNICEEIFEDPDNAAWPSRKTSIWYLTVFESEDEETDSDYSDTHRY